MQSIATETPKAQRESHKTFLLDNRDEFHKQLTQAKALVNLMIANDNLDGIPLHTISDLLWNVADRLNALEQTFTTVEGYLQ